MAKTKEVKCSSLYKSGCCNPKQFKIFETHIPHDHLKINQFFLSHFFLSEKRENTESVSESEQLMSQGQYLRV